VALFLIMYKIILLLCFFVISCSSNNISLQSQSCQNNGTIDFLYIHIPCNSCINLVEEIIESNEGIFDYNIIGNKDTHILINYCYNQNKTSKMLIQEMFLKNGFAINQQMTDMQIDDLESLCCLQK
tara:strand:+ start:201 stop:578 length:378 start_codon:yes stop_codon:yes gene_type:complete